MLVPKFENCNDGGQSTLGLPSMDISQIQHVKPDFEDQHRIQEFEGNDQIWVLGLKETKTIPKLIQTTYKNITSYNPYSIIIPSKIPSRFFQNAYYSYVYCQVLGMRAVRASIVDVSNVPNAKYLAHLVHQTKKNPFYEMFQIL